MITNGHSSAPRPSASIVVVSYNTSAHIGACLTSLMSLDWPQIEIIVVDNGSTDGSAEMIRSSFPDVDLVELPDNKGFAGGASVGLYMASGDLVAVVNPDVVLDSRWLVAVSDTLTSHPNAGVVGSKILYPDGRTLQHAGGIVHYPLATTEHIGRGEADRGQYDRMAEVPFVTGAALAMWRQVGRDLRFFDEEYYPLYFEDVDLCYRARDEGLKVLYQPKAVAYHKETVTLDRRSTRYYSYFHVNRLRFVVKRYSPEQVMLDFLPAEAARIAGDMDAEDRTASLALLDNRAPAESSPGETAPTQRRFDTLQSHLGEVMGGWRVRERPFRSSAPILGRLVVKMRERINNLSTRWYVQPILQQQVEYNASVARMLREMSRQLSELEARVATQAILTAGLVSRRDGTLPEDLNAEIESLRARLEELEQVAEQDVLT